MPVRNFLFAFALSMLHGLTAAASAGAQRWVFEAVGAQAPQQEHFEVRPGSVRWVDAQGRTQWHQRRDNGQLTLIDHDARIFYRLDEAGIALMRAGLQAAMAAQRVKLDAAASPAPQRPWSALAAADQWAELEVSDRVAGVACRRLAVKAGTRPVGEACVADPSAVAGGAALQVMLRAQGQVADRLRAGLPGGAAMAWPLHPLVAAARSGRLPLRVVEAVEGECRNELRLASVHALPLAPQDDGVAVVPAGYRPAAAGR